MQMTKHLSRWVAGKLGRRPHRARPLLELLEDRLAPAVFNVNTTADLSLAPGVNPDGTIKGTTTITLRSAIQAANSTPGGNTINLTRGGTYQISLAPTTPNETDNLAGEFAILPTGNLTIQNTSFAPVTVSGGGQSRVFDINPNDTVTSAAPFLVTMRGFTITNGRAFDATGANPDGAVATGGGIRDQGNESLTLTGMVVKNNSATADGGGIGIEDTVDSNWTLTINASLISGNHAGDAGGGIDTDGKGNVVINPGTVITGNTDVNQGAGVYLDAIGPDSANLTMTGVLVKGNSSTGTVNGIGGGISNAGNGAVTLTRCTVANNSAVVNGGGFSDENNGLGTLTVTDSVFANNSAGGNGGAIFASGPSATIKHSSFNKNISGGSGGAVFDSGTTLTVRASTFAGNTANGNGGALEIQTTGSGATGSSITNATITGNSALNSAGGSNGGGIDAPATFTGTLALLNATINGNSADNGGGIFWAGTAGSAVTVQNTIIAKNTATTAGPDANNPAGKFTDNGGNLIGSTSGNSGFTAPTTQTGVDPLLGPLQYNGGPIIGFPGAPQGLQTEALQSGSPAINKGVLAGAPPVDERGFPRPDKAGELPDIGAFEVQDGFSGGELLQAVKFGRARHGRG
jgi:predicted outer membrane repeat protein